MLSVKWLLMRLGMVLIDNNPENIWQIEVSEYFVVGQDNTLL